MSKLNWTILQDLVLQVLNNKWAIDSEAMRASGIF